MLRKFLILTFITFTGALFTQPVWANLDYAENFKAYLENESLKTLGHEPLYEDDLLNFYKARDFKPVWFDEDNDKIRDIKKFQKIISEQAYINGLEPGEYKFQKILKTKTPETGKDYLFEREWMLTNTVMHYINDIRTGRLKPHQYDSMIFTLPQHRALDKHTAKFLKARNPEKYLKSLAPQQAEYKQLREKLESYRKIEKNGGWPNVALKQTLYPGEANKSVPQIRARLEASSQKYDGQLPKGIWIDKAQLAIEELVDRITHQNLVTDPKDEKIAAQNPAHVYDGRLAKRVAEFQYFHGKKADGVIGPETIEALNAPVKTKIDKIKLAMERWRWLPDDLGRKHVRVNIAAFYARAVENGKDQFVMPIIVGQVVHQTPVFSSVIKNVKIHPDWTSPDSIASRYVIPKIQKNPGVVHRLGYQIQNKQTGEFVSWDKINVKNLHKINLANYQFRQKPGNRNALGLARFSIENDYAIFMHGTPDDKLFNEDDRNYSSGCIRVENPLVMAHFLLNDQGISRRELEDLYLLKDNEFPDTTYINLKENVPVHLMYMTAWIDQKGYLHFADDAYGRDEKLKTALKKSNG